MSKYLESLASNRLDKIATYATERLKAPANWLERLYLFAPKKFNKTIGFAEHHKKFWEWRQQLRRGIKPPPFIAIWARGGGKSTNVEGLVFDVGAQGDRKFCLYVRATQQKANESVGNIQSMIEASSVELYYPKFAERKVGKFGSSKGWRMEMLRCGNGFNVVGLGLDVAVRGVKLDEYRPDLIVFDDIDDVEDTTKTIEKKINKITRSILPAGSSDCAVVFVQNLIHSESIVNKIVTGDAKFLTNRVVSGPHKAIEGLRYKIEHDDKNNRDVYTIVEGEATWAGQDLETCQAQITEWGIDAFLEESQHEVDNKRNGLLKQSVIDRTRVNSAPKLRDIVVGFDPSGSEHRDEAGIVVVGLGVDEHIYVLADNSLLADVATRYDVLIDTAKEWDCDTVVVEVNYGGDQVPYAIQKTKGGEYIYVVPVVASRGKKIRAKPTVQAFNNGTAHIVGYMPKLERELTKWQEGDKSPNRLDALVFGAMRFIRHGGQLEVVGI